MVFTIITYFLKCINPFIITTFDIAILCAFSIVTALAFRIFSWISSGTIQIRWAYFPLVFWLQPSCTTSTCLVQIPTSANFLKIALINEEIGVRFRHISLIHWQNQTVIWLWEDLLARSISAQRSFVDTHACSSACFIWRAPFSSLFVPYTPSCLVAIHTEVALRVEVALIVKLNTSTNTFILATTNGYYWDINFTILGQKHIDQMMNLARICIQDRESWGIHNQ